MSGAAPPGPSHARAAARRHWVFDLDGTLTVAVHDFEAIRRELGLPHGQPILEALDALPPTEARALFDRLDAIELELARSARAAQGAARLLDVLAERGDRVGILTRNSHANALETLRVSGLASFFEPGDVLGRENVAPKPSPEGILHLLSRWAASPSDSVMVGDYLYDLLAGRAARALTVHVDPSRRFPWPDHADLEVDTLEALHGAVLGSGRAS